MVTDCAGQANPTAGNGERKFVNKKLSCLVLLFRKIALVIGRSCRHNSPVRGTTDRNHPGMIVTTCMSYLTTGGPGKERGTNKRPPTGRIRERSKGERGLQSICPINLPESFSLESILAERCTPPGRTLSQSDWPETTRKLTPLP